MPASAPIVNLGRADTAAIEIHRARKAILFVAVITPDGERTDHPVSPPLIIVDRRFPEVNHASPKPVCRLLTHGVLTSTHRLLSGPTPAWLRWAWSASSVEASRPKDIERVAFRAA